MKQKNPAVARKRRPSTYLPPTYLPPEAQRQTLNHGEKSDFSQVTQFHARYVNGTLLSKATLNSTPCLRKKQSKLFLS